MSLQEIRQAREELPQVVKALNENKSCIATVPGSFDEEMIRKAKLCGLGDGETIRKTMCRAKLCEVTQALHIVSDLDAKEQLSNYHCGERCMPGYHTPINSAVLGWIAFVGILLVGRKILS